MSITDFIIWNTVLNNSASNLELPSDMTGGELLLMLGVLSLGAIFLCALITGIAFLFMALIDWCSDKYWEHQINKRK